MYKRQTKVSIGHSFICDYGCNIHIGNNVTVNTGCTFVDCNKITIGNNVLICLLYTSSYQAMVHDAARYMPSIGKTVYRDSLWEVKTVLPISEVDDSRPILFKSNYAGISGYHCIMGGKIDNIYDCMDFIRQIERNGPSSS